jgi:hypothetical protein
MANANEEEIVQVGGKDNVVRGILLIGLFELGSRFVCRLVPIVFVCAKTELQMVGRNELF